MASKSWEQELQELDTENETHSPVERTLIEELMEESCENAMLKSNHIKRDLKESSPECGDDDGANDEVYGDADDIHTDEFDEKIATHMVWEALKPQLNATKIDGNFSSSLRCSCYQPSLDRRLSGIEEYVDHRALYGFNTRITDVDTMDGQLIFVIKVERIHNKQKWEVRKSFAEIFQFYQAIKEICTHRAPVKQTFWGTMRGLGKAGVTSRRFRIRGAVGEHRREVFDSFLARTAALVSPAPIGPRRLKALVLLQEFVGFEKATRDHRSFDSNDDDFSGAGSTSSTVTSICTCFKSQGDASQLVADVFGSPDHEIAIECREFCTDLIEKTQQSIRTSLSDNKARAILKTVAKKMGALKEKMSHDNELEAQLLTIRESGRLEDIEYDEFCDELRHAISIYVQNAVLIPLEDHIQESLFILNPDDDERAITKKIRYLQTKPQSYFGIPTHLISPNDWEEARRELHRIDEYSLPLDKLRCIVRSASAIFQSCNRQVDSNMTSMDQLSQFTPALTTDEFIPIHLFVVVTSLTTNLLKTMDLLKIMCDNHDKNGEIGYYLTNFEGAVSYIQQRQRKDVEVRKHAAGQYFNSTAQTGIIFKFSKK